MYFVVSYYDIHKKCIDYGYTRFPEINFLTYRIHTILRHLPTGRTKYILTVSHYSKSIQCPGNRDRYTFYLVIDNVSVHDNQTTYTNDKCEQ